MTTQTRTETVEVNMKYFLFIFACFYSVNSYAFELDDAYFGCGDVLNGLDKFKKNIDNKFISNLIGNELVLDKITKIYPEKDFSRYKIENPGDIEKSAEVVVVKSSGDYFSFYLVDDKAILLCASITSNRMGIGSYFKTGQSLNKIKNKFPNINNSNLIVVQDVEGGNIVGFLFKDEVLNRIVYESRYLD